MSKAEETGRKHVKRPKLWIVAGGKGGSGKSVVSTGLACALSSMDKSVILVDADLGGANLHTFLDLPRSGLTLEDFLSKSDMNITKIIKPGPIKGLKVILGADGMGNGRDFSSHTAEKLLATLHRFDADHVLCDLGAGSSPFQLTLFNNADLPVLVINPEPTSVENAYTFLKLSVLERIRSHFGLEDIAQMLRETQAPKQNLVHSLTSKYHEDGKNADGTISGNPIGIVVNRVSKEASLKLAWGFASVATEHLGIPTGYAGFVEEDPSIALLASRKFVFSSRKGATIALECIRQIAKRGSGGEFKPVPTRTPKTGLDEKLPLFNDEITVDDKILHIQTEDLGPRERAVLSLVYSRGRIVFKKRLGYEELAAKAMGRAGQQERVEWFHKAMVAGVLRNRIDGGEAA
ncbi:MAG: MinD/ParA family protein [Deltaproteobacteria bacterium]|nr:MinD/ParA family protein [Deltaproteobacteria bacterium]